jgi:AraC-like DNA-binding protein
MAAPAPDLGTIHHAAHLSHLASKEPSLHVHRWHVIGLHRAVGEYGLGNESIHLRGPTLMLLPAGDRDENRLVGRDIAWWCQFDGKALRSTSRGAELNLGSARVCRSRARPLSSSEDRTAGAWFRALLGAWRQGTPEAELQVRARLLDLLALWATPAHAASDHDCAGADRLRAAIESHACNESLSLSALARAADATGTSITAAFRHRYGTTPVAYRIRQRLHHTCELLAHSSHTLDDIAQRCGFADAGYLCRVFRQHFGISPRTYARRCRTLVE